MGGVRPTATVKKLDLDADAGFRKKRRRLTNTSSAANKKPSEKCQAHQSGQCGKFSWFFRNGDA